MTRRNVFVGIPTRTSDVKIEMTTSLVGEVYQLGQADMAMTLFCWSGDPLISHSRNVILATFLTQTDCDDLVFIDDDVSWPPGTMVKLLQHPVDIVAGAYRHKKDPESYPVNWLPGADGKQWADKETGLLEVRDVPFGFCRISRKAAQRMYDAAEDKPFPHLNAPDLACRVVFDVAYEDGLYYGEDYVFCRKWRSMGGKVWLDPELALNHTGHKTFIGHVGNWLRGDRGEQQDYRSMLKDVQAAIGKAA